MDDSVANVELVELTAEGVRLPIRIEIGKPCPDGRGAWDCPVLVGGIDGKLRHAYGEDSLQALCLGLRLVHRLLECGLKQGSRLIDPLEGTDFRLDAYFGVSSVEIMRPSP